MILRFLKEIPDKWYLLVLFSIVFVAYLWLRVDFLGQLAQTIVGSILALVGVRKLQQITADEVQTGDVVMPSENISNSKEEKK